MYRSSSAFRGNYYVNYYRYIIHFVIYYYNRYNQSNVINFIICFPVKIIFIVDSLQANIFCINDILFVNVIFYTVNGFNYKSIKNSLFATVLVSNFVLNALCIPLSRQFNYQRERYASISGSVMEKLDIGSSISPHTSSQV